MLGVATVAMSSPPSAQGSVPELLRRALEDPAVIAALENVDRAEERAVSTLIELSSIISTTGYEHERAAAVARRMQEIGLSDVAIDTLPDITGTNVTGTIPGTSGRALVFVNMLDDLPAIARLQRRGLIETFRRDGHVRREGDRVVGHATELQAGTAAILVAAEALQSAGVRLRHDLVFAGVAREETGLEGMAALYAKLGDRAVGYVEVLGDGREIQYNARARDEILALWRVFARGPAGNTRDGGMPNVPNVNQAIGRAVDRILSFPYPRRYRDRGTKLNIGMLASGEIPDEKPAVGWFSLDIRSLDQAIVDEVEQAVEDIIRQVSAETGIAMEMVPAYASSRAQGEIPGARDAFLTQAAVAVARHWGHEPELSDRMCCNAAVAIAGGTPAIILHGERGGARATKEEWASIRSMMDMARHIVLLAAVVGGISETVDDPSVRSQRKNNDAKAVSSRREYRHHEHSTARRPDSGYRR